MRLRISYDNFFTVLLYGIVRYCMVYTGARCRYVWPSTVFIDWETLWRSGLAGSLYWHFSPTFMYEYKWEYPFVYCTVRRVISQWRVMRVTLPAKKYRNFYYS